MKEKIVFFGSSKFVIPILEVLRKNFDLKLVLTTEKLPTDPIPAYCTRFKVCYYVVTDFRNKKLVNALDSTQRPLGVLASFGAIIPKEILDSFPKGILNVHPSLLPKYRGPTPVQTAILNGEEITGVSIIKLDNQIDHGPILVQVKERILESDTSETLYERLFKKGANLLPKVLNEYINGSLEPKEQDHKKATFTKMLTRQDGYIDISKLKSQNSNLKIDRMIRAYFPWPGVFTKIRIKNHELRIKFLPNKKIQVEGKKPMSYKDFKNGYPNSKQVHALLA